MTGLLEIRDTLKAFYSKNEVFILPIAKFLLAFVTLTVLNGKIGYMSSIDKLPIVLIAALLCSFLPSGFILLVAALFSLLHMYAISPEVALVGLCLYLIMALLYFRFSPRDAVVVILTPMLFAMKLPYVMPIAVGLLGTPVSLIPVAFGTVIYYYLSHVMASATAIGSMDSGEAIAKLRYMIDGLLNNKEMLVIIAAFSVTIVVVYLIRRMSVDYSWTIAMIAGVIMNLLILLIGDLMLDTNVSVGWAILGSVIALIVGKILEFFRFFVDYSRTEKVQFEDDEYYYYVKAVPKMNVAAQTRTVKKINTQTRSHNTARSSMSYSADPGTAEDGYYEEEQDYYSDNEENVITERTSYREPVRRRTVRNSVPLREQEAEEPDEDEEYDFEELE